MNLYFGFLNLYRCTLCFWTYTLGVRAGGRPAGRVGWLKSIGKESILGICILKNLNIVHIIEYWLWGIFTKKTRAENDEDWSDLWAEISHMSPIQARKLKLSEVSVQGELTLMSTNRIKKTNMFSPWGALENASKYSSCDYSRDMTETQLTDLKSPSRFSSRNLRGASRTAVF